MKHSQLGAAIVMVLSMMALRHWTRQEVEAVTATTTKSERTVARNLQYYLLDLPEITTYLVGNFTGLAFAYYESAINEEQAEIWLHRALLNGTDRTHDAYQADVIIVPGYLHLFHHLRKLQKAGALPKQSAPLLPTMDDWLERLSRSIVPDKIHVVATPTWNPTKSRHIGLDKAMKRLSANTLSFGFERNTYWQQLPPGQIVPVPYVVRPTTLPAVRPVRETHNRVPNFVFYAGDSRPHAVEWAGCNRTRLVERLIGRPNTHVQIVNKTNRLDPKIYNRLMQTSQYCLILCGDTPTSRSLASSLYFGCLPVFVGRRWHGKCDPPCHAGWGWTLSNVSHLPFEHVMDWKHFPIAEDEEAFAHDPVASLATVFAHTDTDRLYSIMKRHRLAWIYGHGNPVNSTKFGQAASYAWQALQEHLVESR